MRIVIVGCGIVVGLAGLATVRAQDPAVKSTWDVVYTKAGDRELKLDMVVPTKGAGPFPAVVVIHGGAWRGGDKASNRQILLELAERGYVAISPQYRFCPQDPFPAQVHDVKAAVRWLRAHAADHKINPDKIGAIGFSAGGHLALMLGLTGKDDGLEGDAPADAPSSKVQVVVNFFGPTDLDESDFPDVSKGLIKDFLGGSPAEKADASKQASPATFASSDDPPVLTFQGTKDPLVPHSQATLLADALTAAGASPGSRVELLIGEGHGWKDAALERTKAETFAFLDRYLK